jgi:excisionase family DNA binding protein
MKILLTVEELAKYLKIKPDTIYKKVKRGELPAIKLGKIVRFPKELIDAWILEEAQKTQVAFRKRVKEVQKEVNEARTAIESKVDEAIKEVRKKAKIATKVVQHDVNELIDEVKNSPLNKKQEVVKRGLKHIWKDLNKELKSKGSKKPAAQRKKAQKKSLQTEKVNANEVIEQKIRETIKEGSQEAAHLKVDQMHAAASTSLKLML